MAIYTVNNQGALVANTTKSLILLNPVAKLSLTHIDISMDGSAAAAGVRFDLYRVTTLGSAAGTTATVIKTYASDSASAVTGLTALTTEPTAVEVVQSWYVQPFGGLLPLDAVLDHEVVAPAAGSRIGLRYVNPSGGATCNYQVGLFWSE
jgi:hypothetical protein